MRSIQVLAAVAQRLNHDVGVSTLPALFLLTDPQRLPDPVAAASRLPPGAAVIYRHFGSADRFRTARKLAGLCRRRGLVLLIAADPDLAARVGADGVHWPERLAPTGRTGIGLVTVAAHSQEAVSKAYAVGADACLLSPVFATNSATAGRPLGLFRASQIARCAPLPIVGLGGVNAGNAQRLRGRGFAGLACVEGLSA